MDSFKLRKFGVVAMGLAIAVMVAPPADARRGGSFGSRGARTYTAPPQTAVAPKQTAPVQRSMTEQRPDSRTAAQPAQRAGAAPAPARSGGMAKGLIGGLIAGGLIGALLGGGLGSLGGSGLLIALLQAALIGGLVWFLFRMFRRRNSLAAAGPAGMMQSPFMGSETRPAPSQSFGFTPALQNAPVHDANPGYDIAITDADKETFERLLSEVQDAFGKEDYGRLRELTTPEVMSYFAEELSQNATNGRRNHVSATQLLNAEAAEAWREGSTDYATIAMHYESIDVTLDRTSGAVIEGDPERPTQVTELWTFAREEAGSWRLSAVQEA